MLQAILPDPFEFARRGARLEGEVDALSLERVGELLQATEFGQILTCRISGRREGERSFLDVALDGEVVFECQRCLSDMSYTVGIAVSLLLVPKGDPLPDEALEDDSCDPVHAGRDFDVLAALEDELLLALPISPMHPQNCGGQKDDDGAAGDTGKPSPFAALAALKRKS